VFVFVRVTVKGKAKDNNDSQENGSSFEAEFREASLASLAKLSASMRVYTIFIEPLLSLSST
jgi:hypothetical protein